MHRRRVIELCLDRLDLAVTGSGRQTTSHLLVARLVWPRPAIAEKITVKALDLEHGIVDLSGSGWVSRVLFKESVQGPFGVEVSVTERMAGKEMGEFVKNVAGAVFRLAGGSAGELVGGGLGGGLVSIPFRHLAKVASRKKNASAGSIGFGSKDMLIDGKWTAGKPVKLEIPLTAPETVYETVRRRKHGETSARRRTLLEAGGSNGAVVLSATVYE